MICPNCKKEIADNSRFCGYCGGQIPQTVFCSKCGAECAPGSRFCGRCGAPITAGSVPQQNDAPRREVDAAAALMKRREELAALRQKVEQRTAQLTREQETLAAENEKLEQARAALAAQRAEEERLAREAEERRRAEEAARKAEEERLAREAEERRKAEEEARLLEEKRRAEEAARKAEEERLTREAEERRKAEEALLLEEKRKAEEAARKAEEERLAQEAEAEENKDLLVSENTALRGEDKAEDTPCEDQPADETTGEKKNSKRRVIAAIVTLAALGAWFFACSPKFQYIRGMRAMEQGDYEAAIGYFEELSEKKYKDAKDMLRSCNYEYGVSLIEQGDYEEAYRVLTEELPDQQYRDVEVQTAEASLGCADILLERRDYKTVMAILLRTKVEELLADQEYVQHLDKVIARAAKIACEEEDYYNALEFLKMSVHPDTVAEYDKEVVYQVVLHEYGKVDQKKLISMLEELGDYKDSAEKRQEFMYAYAMNTPGHANVMKWTYLKELKDAGYKDSAKIFADLYAWKVSIVAVNTSEKDLSTNMTSFSSHDTIYFHIKVTGGEPGASLNLHCLGDEPDGSCFGCECRDLHDGCTAWVTWYDSREGVLTGPLYYGIYDEGGYLVASTTVNLV